MCREIRAKKSFKFHKKGYMAMELTENLMEIAPGVKGQDTFLWDKKLVTYFSSEEKMRMISFIDKNNRKFIDGDKMEPMPHMESTSPKTIFLNVQLYNKKAQLKIFVQPKEGKGLIMSLDWGQVTGFRLWLEECLKKDIIGRNGNKIEAYLYLSGVEDKPIKTARFVPKELGKGDLYMWDEVTKCECTGRLYDPYESIWTLCFKFAGKVKPRNKKKFENRLGTARDNAQ